MFKITFKFNSPISMIDGNPPVFDSLLSLAVYQEKYRGVGDYKSYTGKEVNLERAKDLPLRLDECGFFHASSMFYKSSPGIESVSTWKKRWNRKRDLICDFGNSKRRVHGGSGPYKNYNQPIVTISIPEAWFYFVPEKDSDIDVIAGLIEDHFAGIGKKVSTGYGWYSRFDIRKDESRIPYYLCRPVPSCFVERHMDLIVRNSFTCEKAYGAFLPPYWHPANQGEIWKIHP